MAIKKIGNAFENLTDARRTLREIKLLRHLRHENIIAVSERAAWLRVFVAVRACATGRVTRPPVGACVQSERWAQLQRSRRARALNTCAAMPPTLKGARHHDAAGQGQVQRRVPRVRAHGHRPAPDHPLLAAAHERALSVLYLPGACCVVSCVVLRVLCLRDQGGGGCCSLCRVPTHTTQHTHTHTHSPTHTQHTRPKHTRTQHI